MPLFLDWIPQQSRIPLVWRLSLKAPIARDQRHRAKLMLSWRLWALTGVGTQHVSGHDVVDVAPGGRRRR
jgi:hypothetical protein